jgi:UDP-N-acetylmuramoyl-tripeptide--D-alanyl-D-alanine ligase
MIAEWLPVDILVYTRFPDMPVHVGNFDSPTELIKEKLSLLQSLKPSGTLILNGDDPRVREITDFTDVRAVTYGAGGDTDVRVSRIQNAHFEDGVLRGIQFTMTVDDVSVPLEVRHVIATHHVMNMAAAVAVALEIDVSPEDAIAALADLTPTKGRMTVMDGIKKTTIIDDSYNSSPIAAMEALKVLGALKPAGRRLAVLGDMLELGALTDEAHDEVGEAAGRNADFLIVVGTACNSVIGGALRGGLSEKNILEFETSRLAGKNLERLLEPGDVVLIKGSQGMRMEQVVLEIMAHPEQAQNLLVRQGDEWLKR